MISYRSINFVSSLVCSATLVIACIIMHELAHLVTAKLIGFGDVTFYIGGITTSDLSHHGLDEIGLVALAGPAASGLLIALGILLHHLLPGRLWPLALAFAAASRFAFLVPFSISAVYAHLKSESSPLPMFDEVKAASAFRLPDELILHLGSAGFTCFIIWFVSAVPRKHSLPATLASLVSGAALGWGIWLGLAVLIRQQVS